MPNATGGSCADEGVGPTKTAEPQPCRTRPGGRLRTRGSALQVSRESSQHAKILSISNKTLIEYTSRVR
jgi:hypothetical protein